MTTYHYPSQERNWSPLIGKMIERSSLRHKISEVQSIDQAGPTVYPLSYGQRALWFLQKLVPDYAAYNIARAARIRHPLDMRAFRNAFQRIVDRHEILRATFRNTPDGPIQEIHEHMRVGFQEEDASGWSEAQLYDRLGEEIYKPFDLEHGPLLRVNVFTRSAQEHVVLMSVHHIASDLWSVAIMLHELGAFYSAELSGAEPSLNPPRAQYPEFVRAQMDMLASPEGEQHWEYWKRRLTGELPELNLLTDRPRPATQTFRGTLQFRMLSAELTRKLREISSTQGVSLHAMLLAAFQVLLHRYTGQDDILVGYPKANRSPRMATAVGYFVNPIIIRADLSNDPPFSHLLRDVHRLEQEAAEHDAYPLALLVERLQPTRDVSRPSLFQAMFAWQKTARLVNRAEMTAFALGAEGGRLALGDDLQLESITMEQQVSPFDLTLLMAESGEQLAASLEYNSHLFFADTIRRMLGHFETLLESIAADPDQRLSKLALLTPAERRQILVDWNDTALDPGPLSTLAASIEAQAARAPQATAVICEENSFTYRELNERANQLAHYLQKIGVEPETAVATYLERSEDAVTALLGILKSGGVYVPLDPAYPQDRLTYMLKDAQASVLITHRALAIPALSDIRVVRLDADWDTISKESAENPASRPSAEHPACVIYTSGSTGNPKGVVLSYGALSRHCWDTIAHYGLSAQDRVLQFASLGFDQSIEQILPTLIAGATVVMRGPNVWSPTEFNEKVKDLHITVANLPTDYWHQLTQNWHKSPESAPYDQLRLVFPGGDRVRPEIVRLWQQSPMRAVRLLNAYGPTETTVTATTFEIYPDFDASSNSIPIGRPLGNRRIYILDKYGNPTPIGVPGELHIGGAGLARGYLHQPELTAQKFVADPFSGHVGARLYKTGDLARYRPDGSIEFLGRMDQQVKIRGFRIELGEIETALGAHPEIRQVVVQAIEDDNKNKSLVAYIVPHKGVSIARAELQGFLRDKLPEYMIPSSFMFLAEMPLTASGKIDRRSLPRPNKVEREMVSPYVPPRTPFEKQLADVWEQLLGIERVGIYDNFFELGGHSLLAVQLCARLYDIFHVEVPVRSLFEAPTIAGLSDEIMLRQALLASPQELEELLQEVDQLSDDQARRELDKLSV